MSDPNRPRWQHDSTAEIEIIKRPDVARQIGAVAGWPTMHYGRNEWMVETFLSKPTLTAISYGRWVPALEARPAWLADSREVLAGVDGLIAELQRHKARLEALLEEEANDDL
jgi:hypothetical protein